MGARQYHYWPMCIRGILILAILTTTLYSQIKYPRFEHFSVDEGVPATYAVPRVQDDLGFLWIASNGLTRYDGYTFKTFTHDPQNPHSISSNDITNSTRSIVYSMWGGEELLWISASNALNRFDLRTETFSRYVLDPDLTIDEPRYWFSEAYEDRRGYLWLRVSNEAFYRFDKDAETFIKYIEGDDVRFFYEDAGDTIWVCTYKRKVFYYDVAADSFVTGDNANQAICQICEAGLRGYKVDPQGALWGRGGTGILRFDAGSDTGIYYEHNPDDPASLPSNKVNGIFEDESGILWMSLYNNGLAVFNRPEGTFQHFPYESNREEWISSNTLSPGVLDRSGVRWMGGENGLNKWDPQRNQFRVYKHQRDDEHSLNSNIIQELHMDPSGILWIGTDKGLNRFDTESGRFKRYPLKAEALFGGNRNSLRSIMQDATGILWLSTGIYIDRFDPTGDRIFSTVVYPKDRARSADASILDLLTDSKGLIWMGARWQLHHLDPNSGEVLETYLPSGTTVRIIREAANGLLWIGTWRSGLILLDPNDGSWLPIEYSPEGESDLASQNIEDILLGTNGIIWVATNAGLHELKPSSLYPGQYICKRYAEKDGLRHPSIYGLIEGDSTSIWMAAVGGLAKLDLLSRTFKWYDKTDGLASNSLTGAMARSADGSLYIGSTEGLTVFHPDSLKDNPHIPNIVLTDFQIFHKPVPIKSNPESQVDGEYTIPMSISYLDSIELSYRENVFSLEFSAMDFRNPMKNQYAYMLEGFNDDWTYTDANGRYVTYTNIDPGDYTFKVKGSNNDGLWNEKGRSLFIRITPPWWQTRLAYAGYILLGLSMLSGLWWFQLSRIRLRHQVELEHVAAERYQELDELKSRFFTNISHEFRTPLTLILGPIGKMLSKLKDSEWDQDLNIMQRHARRLLELVSQLLDLSKLEAGRLKLQAAERNLIPLLKGLVLSFASLAERRQITLSFNSDHEEVRVFVEKDAMSKIMNNLLSNAFKFTGDRGEIQVRVLVNESSDLSPAGEIVIDVSDTGVGIPADRIDHIFDRFFQVDSSETREREGTGIGLALTQELVELHHGSIEVDSTEGSGTTFTIRLPLGSTHLDESEIVDYSDTEDEDLRPPEVDFGDSDDIQPPSEGAAKPLILLVEDNTDVRSFTRSYLDEDFRCIEAVDGEDGLQKTLEKIPDLIVSDIMMPKMDGVELCKRIKTDERSSHIPVILLTAKADIGSKLEGLETGADDYLTKPFEGAELQVRIRNLIAQRKLLRDHFQKELSIVPADMDLSSMDAQFLEKVIKLVNENLTEPDFNVEWLSKKIFMSRQNLNRKLKALTGHNTTNFIRSMRLKRAAVLLQNKEATITEIAFQVGYSSSSHFTKAFQEEFGQTPTAFQTLEH